MHLCKKCDKKFERRSHLARHLSIVHQTKAASKAGADQKSRKEPSECRLPGDHWPRSQQVVVATGQAGDIIPWSSDENLLLLAPSGICGVHVPEQWRTSMVMGILGITKETLRGVQRSAGPQLDKLQEEMLAVLRRYRSPAE